MSSLQQSRWRRTPLIPARQRVRRRQPQAKPVEPTVFSPLGPESCYRIFKDVLFALDIIQELNPNTRIWSKQ